MENISLSSFWKMSQKNILGKSRKPCCMIYTVVQSVLGWVSAEAELAERGPQKLLTCSLHINILQNPVPSPSPEHTFTAWSPILPEPFPQLSNPQPTALRPQAARMAVNAAQHKIVNSLKTWWDCFVITCHHVLNGWPKTSLLPVWHRDAKTWDTPMWVTCK